MKDDLEYSDLLAKWLQDDLSDAERLRLKETGTLEDLKIVLEDIGQWSLPAPDLENGLTELRKRLEKKREPKVRRLPVRFMIGVAASFLLVIGFYFGSDWIIENEVSVATTLGEQIDHELPGGSTVKLDALSSISYQSDWENREVRLSGRAYFDVSKGEVFSVKTDQGLIQVLGTEFEVYDSYGRFSVSCFEGSVQVSKGQQIAILTIGETIILDRDQFKRSANKRKMPDWTQGFSQFDDESLQKVIEELKKYYQVQIQLPDRLNTYQFTGRFPHQDLDLALSSIFDPLEISFRLTNGRVEFM